MNPEKIVIELSAVVQKVIFEKLTACVDKVVAIIEKTSKDKSSDWSEGALFALMTLAKEFEDEQQRISSGS